MTKFINKIVNGNSLEILKKIPDKTFNLIFADPPYNLQIGEKLKRPDDSKVNGVDDKWDQFKNFGYGTNDHLFGLKKYGVTKHHRKKFKPVHNILMHTTRETP